MLDKGAIYWAAALGVVVASKREGWNGSRARLALPMLASGVMIGLALMTKPFFGPLAYLFMAPWLIWQRRWRTMAWIAPAVLLGVATGPIINGIAISLGFNYGLVALACIAAVIPGIWHQRHKLAPDGLSISRQ